MSRLTPVVNSAGVPLVTTAETVVASVPGATSTGPAMPVTAIYSGVVNPGTAATSLQIRCRRGVDITGAQVGPVYQPNCTAAVPLPVSGIWEDTPGELANANYVITVQQVAATANGSSTIGSAAVFVGTPY